MENSPAWWKSVRFALTILFLLPIWLLPYLPLNDLPNHLASAHLLIQHFKGGCNFVQPNPSLLVPNSSAFYFLEFFGQWIGVDAAARALLSLYVILLPLSLGYFLKHIRPEFEPFSLAAFAVMFNWFFAMGFLNFVLALPLFLFACGFYLSVRNEKFDIANALFLALLSLLLYFTHASAFLAFFAFAAALFVSDGKKSSKESLRLGAFAFIPPFALFVAFAFSSPPSLSFGELIWGSMARKLFGILMALPNPPLAMVALLVGACHVCIRKIAAKQAAEPLPTKDGPASAPAAWALALALFFLLAYLLLPLHLPDWQFAGMRALPFFFIFAFVCALEFFIKEKGAPADLLLALAVFSLVSFAFSSYDFANASGEVAKVASLSSILTPGASVFPFGQGFAEQGGMLTSPLFHAWGYWVLDKGVFTPYLFSYGYSPLSYYPENLRAQKTVMSWIEALAEESFSDTKTFGTCELWDNYHARINWTLISSNYDYVVFMPGKCDANLTIPGTYALMKNQSGILVYGRAN